MLIPFTKHVTPLLQEASLKQLGRLDGAEGIPELINALGDERARIAIYALRSSLKSLPRAVALDFLRAAPMDKVTVAKEVIRIIGDLEMDGALPLLWDFNQQDLHVDVRGALFRALWSYLDRPTTWEIFQNAACDPNPSTAKAMCLIPDDGMGPETRKKFVGLMVKLFHHPITEVRLAALRRCQDYPLQDVDNTLGPKLYQLVHSPLQPEAAAAAKAIFQLYMKSEPEKVAKFFQHLLPEYLLLRSTLDLFVAHMEAFLSWNYFPASAISVLAVLKQERKSVLMRLTLLFRGLQWNDMKYLFFDMIPGLHAEAVSQALMLIRYNHQRRTSNENLEAEAFLRGNSYENARLLGLAFFTTSIIGKNEWTDEQRKILAAYREDESIMVAEQAWALEVPPIEETVEETED